MRVELAFDRAEACREEGRPLLVVPGPVIAADGVMMGDGAALRQERIARSVLDDAPLVDELAMAAKRGDKPRFLNAPRHAPRRRLDETRAARQPVLRWVQKSEIIGRKSEKAVDF